MIALTLRVKTAQATTIDQQRFVGPTYGIEPAERAYRLKCARAEWTLFTNRELDSDAGLDALFGRPWLAALFARWHVARIPTESGRTRVERVSADAQYLMLTRPVGNAARVDVVRSDGDVLYTGIIERAALAFAISDVEQPGTAPTKVTGNIVGRRIKFEAAFSFATRTGTRSTEPAITS
jgi:hypothetical protein